MFGSPIFGNPHIVACRVSMLGNTLLGAEHPSPQSVNLFNYGRII